MSARRAELVVFAAAAGVAAAPRGRDVRDCVLSDTGVARGRELGRRGGLWRGALGENDVGAVARRGGAAAAISAATAAVGRRHGA